MRYLRRVRCREPHHGRLGKRYPVLSTVVRGVPDLKAPGGRAGALPGKAGSVLFMKNLNGQGR